MRSDRKGSGGLNTDDVLKTAGGQKEEAKCSCKIPLIYLLVQESAFRASLFL